MHVMPADTPAPPPPPPGPATAIDATVLDALRHSRGDAVVRDLIRLFTADSLTRAARIRDALARGDLASIAGEAHTLRSAAATLGAFVLASRAGALEDAATDGSHTDASSHFALLELELTAALAALAALLP